MIFYLFVWLSLWNHASALTFFNVPPNDFGGSTIYCDTVLMRQQWNNVDFSSFGRNYSLFTEPNGGCYLPLTPGTRQQAYFISRLSFQYNCSFPSQQVAVQDAGYGAAVCGDGFCDFYLSYLFAAQPKAKGIPLVTGAGENSLPQINQFGGCNAVVSSFIPDPNITMFLDFPSPNALYEDCISYTGGCYNIMYISLSFGIFLCVASAMKFAVIQSHEGRIQASIPQLVLAFCFLVGLMSILVSFGGNQALYGTIYVYGWRFFEWWTFSAAYSALLVLGLYFKEISCLTTSNSGAGRLEYMKLPLIILISFLWAVTIVNSFLQAFPVQLGSTAVVAGFSQFALSIYCLMSAVVLAVTIYGSVSLVFAMSYGQKSFWTIVLVISVTSFSAIVVIICCILNLVVELYIGGWGGPVGEEITGFQWNWLTFALTNVAPTLACIPLVFLFRVSVSKEIELSRSATSSTSYSSKSSSTTSSSASQEPVVEL